MPDPTVFTYDVFISYSHVDKAWVNGELLPRLEEAGLKVCIDQRDFRPGAPSVKEMARAVQSSRKTVLVLTPAYLGSAWAEFERLMLQTLDPAARELRLIPLLKVKCDLPLEIGYLTYVNFADPDDPTWPWTQLLTALGAAPIQEAAPEPDRPGWFLPHPYPAQPNFTGRAAERRMLSDWLADDPATGSGLAGYPLLVLRALGGFGKSALAWHWLHHDVDPTRWPRAVWWSFYEEDNQFDSFLRRTLEYLLGPRGAGRFRSERQLAEYLGRLGPRQQADLLLDLLRQPGTLLILDGFERALRAFSSMMAAYQGDEGESANQRISESPIPHPRSDRDCTSPIAEHFLRSLATLSGLSAKVLMTTRLRPRIVEGHGEELLLGCCERELTQMDPPDAVAFFCSQGIRGARGEIEAACAPFGYHPLSLRLLAGLIVRDLRQPGDIVAAQRLDVSGDQIRHQHHVLEQAYESLTPDRRRLLSRIACFRGPVGYEALAVLADEGRGEGDYKSRPYDLDADLHDLISRGLLHRNHRTNRFDLHPIVRRYAYDRLAGGDRAAAHARLRDYFAAVPSPERVVALDDLAPMIELYHHTVRVGQYDSAFEVFWKQLVTPLYYQLGNYSATVELIKALFAYGENRAPHITDVHNQALALHALGNSYSLGGQPGRAIPLFGLANEIDERRGDKKNLSIGLGNLAFLQTAIGALHPAESSLRRRIALGQEIGDKFSEAIGHQELGRLLAYRGAWEEAEAELADALELFEK